jgi:hypothetical protein
MMGLGPSAPAAAPEAALQLMPALEKALDLISDAAATKKTVQALNAASAESRTLLETVRAESAALDLKRKAHDEQLQKERANQAAILSQERDAFDRECAERRRVLSEMEAAVREEQKSARAENERAAALSARLEKRLKVVRAAASAAMEA